MTLTIKLRTFVASILIASLSLLFLTSCGGGGTSSTASNAESQTDSQTGSKTADNITIYEGKLTMATESGFAPYEYLEGQEIVGVDVDIANEIAKELGVELDIVDMAFDAIPQALHSGKADVGIAGMSITEERKQQVDFSIEYAATRKVVMVLKDSPYQKASELEGKVIAVQQGTLAEYETEKYIPGVTILPSKKYFEAMSNLKTGRADAIVMDELPALQLLGTGEEFRLLEEPLFEDAYAIAVKKGNQQMLDVVNKVLQRLLDEGKIDEFTKKHEASNEPVE